MSRNLSAVKWRTSSTLLRVCDSVSHHALQAPRDGLLRVSCQRQLRNATSRAVSAILQCNPIRTAEACWSQDAWDRVALEICARRRLATTHGHATRRCLLALLTQRATAMRLVVAVSRR